MAYKDERECWLLGEFKNALNNVSIDLSITIKCGEKDFSDGMLIIDNKEIPVQIVTAEGVRLKKSAITRKEVSAIIYDVEPIKWIKNALEQKVAKNYANADQLTVLIEYSGLNSINEEYLKRELRSAEIVDASRLFKSVYVLSPSDNPTYIERSPRQAEPILFEIKSSI